MFSIHLDTTRADRGGQTHVLLTVLGLRTRGHRAVLVAEAHDELQRRVDEGLELVPLAMRADGDFAAAWRLSRVLRELEPEVVHAHDARAAAITGLALSIAPPDPVPLVVAARRAEAPLRRDALSRWTQRHVDGYVCASEALRQGLVESGIEPARTATVHDGIDVERVVRTAPLSVHAELWLPAHAPVAGNLAALVPQKGQRYLVDAAPLVLRELPDARIAILGEGALEAPLQRQIRDLGLEKHVRLSNAWPDALALLKTVDLFVFPSIAEGPASALLAAMAAERAVVSTRVGGIPEIVADGETGILVPPRDPEALAGAIVRLLGDPARRTAMGRAGLARVRARFTADRMVEATLEVYRMLAGRRAQGGAR